MAGFVSTNANMSVFHVNSKFQGTMQAEIGSQESPERKAPRNLSVDSIQCDDHDEKENLVLEQ